MVIATFQGRYYTQLSKETPDEHKFELTNPPLSDAADAPGNCARPCVTPARWAMTGIRGLRLSRPLFVDRHGRFVRLEGRSANRVAQNFFGAKVTQVKIDGTPTIGAEAFTVPRVDARHPRASDKSVKTFIFDAYPEMIDVPR